MLRLRTLLALAALCLLAASAGALAPSRAAAAACEQKLFDGGGYFFDLMAHEGGPQVNRMFYAAVQEGGSFGPAEIPPGPVRTTDSYDEWGGLYVFALGADLTKPTFEDKYLGPADACSFDAGRNELAYPSVHLHGLDVQRRWLVDQGPLHGARMLDVLHNPGSQPISVTVLDGDASGAGNLGSDTSTAARATSSGAPTFSPASVWGVSSDGQGMDPTLAHVWDGAGGALRTSEVSLGAGEADALHWDWKLTVPPGATESLISYEIQNAVPGRNPEDEAALAAFQAEAREHQTFAQLYDGMSTAEIAGTQNWAHPAATATIASLAGKANAARPVVLDGSASVGTVPGLPQCTPTYSWTTDDGATSSAATLSHIFSAGTHHASLTVGNGCGGSQTTSVTFEVAKASSGKALRLGKLKLNPRKGTASLRVSALLAGKLTLAGKGVAKQRKTLKRAGSVALLVKPTGRTRAKLAQTGRAKVKVTVTLQPRGAAASKLTKTLTLRRR